jgi:hypothetical protein
MLTQFEREKIGVVCICDVVLFLLSHIDWKRGEKVKHHAIVKRLMRHPPWAVQRVTLKVDVVLE